MSKNSKPQSVTMVGGHNVAPTQTKTPRGRPPKKPEPEEQKPAASLPPEPEKTSAPETTAEETE